MCEQTVKMVPRDSFEQEPPGNKQEEGSETIYYQNYFRGFFVFIIFFSLLVLVCTFRRSSLFTFYLLFFLD